MKNPIPSRLCALVLCAALLLTLLLPAAAMAKAEGMLSADLDGFFTWVYCTDSLPGGASLRDQTLLISSLYHASGQPEGLTGCTVEFVGGDEHLQEAVKVSCTRVNNIDYSTLTENTTVTAEISIDNSLLSEPGSATFTFAFESEHYALRKTETLRVLAGEGLPSIRETFEDPVFYMKPGNTFTTGDATRALLTSDLLEFCAANNLPVPRYGGNIERSAQPGLDYLEGADLFTVTDYGVYPLTLRYCIANAEWAVPFRVQSKSYFLRGASWIMPGQTAQYRITDEDAAASRKFTFSVSGGDAEIDPQTGLLSVPEQAAAGNTLTVAITPEGDEPYTTTVRVVDGQLSSALTVEPDPEPENGFQVPVPAGWKTTISPTRENGWIYRSYGAGEGGSSLILEASTDTLGNVFREDDLAVLSYYDTISFNNNARNLTREDIRIDGHVARLYTYTILNQNNQLYRVGEIVYARNNTVLSMNLYASRDGADESALPPVTPEDLKKLAALIHYDETQASIRRSDTALSLSAENDARFLSAGKSLRMTASFANPETVNRQLKNDGVLWEILDPATGEPSSAASIDKEGRVSASDDLEEETAAEVRAVSETFGTKASYPLTLLPASRRISILPEEAYFYRGMEGPVSLQAVIDPETVPLKGLLWASSMPEISEVTPGENGAVSVTFTEDPRDLQISVKDPSGRSAKASVRVVDPVQAVSFTVRGYARPGNSISCRAELEPARGIDNRLEWSVDVPENLAVIGPDGVLTISKEAAPGTVITITCKAIGALEPVIATEQITVE